VRRLLVRVVVGEIPNTYALIADVKATVTNNAPWLDGMPTKMNAM
jgi:hypothetical protein